MQFLSKVIGFFRKRKSTKNKKLDVFCQDIKIGLLDVIDVKYSSEGYYHCYVDKMIVYKNNMHLAFNNEFITNKNQEMPLDFHLDDVKVVNAWVLSFSYASYSDDCVTLNKVEFIAESIYYY